ncbi:hypothetical protein EDB89DRAFT_1276273 [Lactarius sanguifluus]|nr:hypothetical protein EDB89DRAFT_755124 [Lactarius sanguifluus]KAH9170617.1 hypothetical protein EDB89DRAFT_1276273 [Lactarius sanguifluus]
MRSWPSRSCPRGCRSYSISRRAHQQVQQRVRRCPRGRQNRQPPIGPRMRGRPWHGGVRGAIVELNRLQLRCVLFLYVELLFVDNRSDFVRQSHRRDQSHRRRAKERAPVDVHGNRHGYEPQRAIPVRRRHDGLLGPMESDEPHLLAPIQNRPSRKSSAVFRRRIYPIPARYRCVDTLSYLRLIQRSRSPCALTALPNRRLPLLGTRRHAVGSCSSRRGHAGRSAAPTPAECTLPSRSSALQPQASFGSRVHPPT